MSYANTLNVCLSSLLVTVCRMADDTSAGRCLQENLSKRILTCIALDRAYRRLHVGLG